jgi:hypothetical protein
MSDAINGIRIGYFGAGLAGGHRLISVSYLSNSLLDKLHLFANAQYHQKTRTGGARNRTITILFLFAST